MTPAAVLQRLVQDDQGSLGAWQIRGAHFCWTLEPPDRGNAAGLSCLPPGIYPCIWRRSPKYGWCYLLTGTEPRVYILAHYGNFAGDVHAGWAAHSKGCILVGDRRGALENPNGRLQRAVLASRPAFRRLNDYFAGQPFDLEIRACPSLNS